MKLARRVNEIYLCSCNETDSALHPRNEMDFDSAELYPSHLGEEQRRLKEVRGAALNQSSNHFEPEWMFAGEHFHSACEFQETNLDAIGEGIFSNWPI